MFECKVRRVEVFPHPNADRLEIVKVDDFRCATQKGRFKNGDLAVYVPEAALVPEWALQHYGFWDSEKERGMLAGKDYNRVKALRLRGEMSQGILFDVVAAPEREMKHAIVYCGDDGELHYQDVYEGQDVAELLGIKKYVPEIPVHMAGQVYYAGREFTVNYDIQNILAHPDVLKENEEVVITEKIHGTSIQIIFIPFDNPSAADENDLDALKRSVQHFAFESEYNSGYILIASKGQGADGLCFKINEENAENLYVLKVMHNRIHERMANYYKMLKTANPELTKPLILQGEIFGAVQDLRYGATGNMTMFRAFDMALGERGDRKYFDDDELELALKFMDIERCPVLYKGPYNKDTVKFLTHKQHSKVDGAEDQISEGIVIQCAKQRYDETIPTMGGRVILKSINEDYLTRKGTPTEFN